MPTMIHSSDIATKTNLKAKIEIQGGNLDEVLFALKEAKRLIEEGNICGFDNNESSSYNFSVEEIDIIELTDNEITFIEGFHNET